MHPLASLVGKTITAVVYKTNPKDKSPATQLFLVFSDGTNYEIYTSGDAQMVFTKGLWPGDIEQVRHYMPEMTIVFDSSKCVPPS